MKKILALAFSLTLLFSGCSVKTKDEVKGNNSPSSAPTTSENTTSQQSNTSSKITPEINLLSMSTNEKIANIVRDQLTKSGFNVKVNLQPDYSSFSALMESGSYDVAVNGWTTVTGNPDYAVRSLYKTGGDYNRSPLSDPEIDNLIDLAASQTPEQYVKTYTEFEKILVEDKAYIIPLYRNIKTQAVNNQILKENSVRISKARSMVWEAIDFVDESKRDKDPMILSQTESNLTSLDPIKGNDGSINMLNTNMYIRIVNLSDDDVVIPDSSLSYNFSIGSSNQDFYFLLRDDVNFARVADKKAVDSGERVGGEDVVFSLSRAKDKNSVPNHRTFTLHENMDKIEIVTDLSILDTKDASGKTIRETLESKAPSAIKTLVDDKTKVNNKDGVYQLVKITTVRPFPQVLNYLAHQSAGIVSKKQVEAINVYDIKTYDRNKDIAYGDQSTITEGSTYNNTLMASGPYIAISKNDYDIKFQKNPGYMPETNNAPIITNYTVKFIKDQDSALSALRSGEIYVLYSVPEAKIDLVKNDPKLTLQEIPSNAITYLNFNMNGRYADENLRKAVMYSINQDEIIAVFGNRVTRTYSTLSPFVDTGNVLNADPAKVAEYLSKVK